MAACIEVGKCGRMLNKFRFLNSKLVANLQIQSKRLSRRASFRISPDDNYGTAENSSNSQYRKSVDESLATEMDENSGDFFGIEGGSGLKKIKEIPAISPVEEFIYLLHKKPTADEEPFVEEKLLVTTFGSVRLDRDNLVKFHGQHDKAFSDKMSLLQPEKYLFGKRQSSNLPKDRNNMQSKASSDINEQKPDGLTALSGQSKLVNQKCMDNFVAVTEHKILHHDAVDEVNICPETGVDHDQNNYIDEQYFSQLEKSNTEQNLKPDYSNDSSNNNKTKLSTTVNDKSNYVDEQYFNQLEEPNIEQSVEHSNSDNYGMYPSPEANCQNSNICAHTLDGDSNYIDGQYFSRSQKQKDTNGNFNQNNVDENTNSIEDQYFNETIHNLHCDSSDHSFETIEHPLGLPHSHLNSPLQSTENSSMDNISIPHFNTQQDKIPEFEKSFYQKMSSNVYSDIINSTKQSAVSNNVNTHASSVSKELEGKIIDEKYGFNEVQESVSQHVKPNIEHPKTAFDYVMKLRKEEKQKNKGNSSVIDGTKLSLGNMKLDSKGFSILKTQVQDFKHVSQDTIVTILKNSILYNENDLVVLSKPYGLVCSGGNAKLNGIDIQACLPDLAKRIFRKSVDPKLHLVHRIDKETTGILVLARTEKMADLMTDLFSRNEIKRIYWVLTRGVPDIPEGIIDIPIAEGMVDHKRRMVLRPDDESIKFLAKPSRKAERAVTHYNIISTQGSAALMEVKPETNAKHQIRVHLGFGLRCPILGDHKYSDLSKIAPQKLPDDMLRRLHVRQSKVRYVPMHLHLKTLILPEILDGKNLFFRADLPYHFATNLRKLKFKKS